MSLTRNDMLTTGNNRRARRRGTVRVSEPSYGFFIAGSSTKVSFRASVAAALVWQEGLIALVGADSKSPCDPRSPLLVSWLRPLFRTARSAADSLTLPLAVGGERRLHSLTDTSPEAGRQGDKHLL